MTTEGWLTVADVEDVHHALHLGIDARRISAAITRSRQITLPALVEYGCLRWAFPQMPALPPGVQDSALGRSLRLIVSPLGLSSSGQSPPRPTDLNPRQSEFWAFASTEEVASDDAEFFKSRFWKSALSVGFANSIAKCLAAGLHEMMTNAAQHSNSQAPMIAGYAVYSNFAQFTVADVGQGVLSALRRVARYKQVTYHSDAIRMAIHDGVTSNPSNNGGFGFHDIFKALAEQWGYLRFRSGEACLLADGTGLNADNGENRPVPTLPGFQVSVSCRAASAPPDHPTI